MVRNRQHERDAVVYLIDDRVGEPTQQTTVCAVLVLFPRIGGFTERIDAP